MKNFFITIFKFKIINDLKAKADAFEARIKALEDSVRAKETQVDKELMDEITSVKASIKMLQNTAYPKEKITAVAADLAENVKAELLKVLNNSMI